MESPEKAASPVRVIHEPSAREPFLVLDKPSGLPSAPLQEGEDSALSRALALFPALAAVRGRKPVERGLVHRIDTLTRGCVLIAASQEAYDSLLEAQKNGLFVKWYRALVDDLPEAASLLGAFPPLEERLLRARASGPAAGDITLTSAFRPYGEKGAAVRPVTGESGRAAAKKGGSRLYETHVHFPAGEPGQAVCRITAGYRHQVRCHLAWLGFPVQGDPLYNPACKEGQALGFTASRLVFPDPCDSSRLMDIRL